MTTDLDHQLALDARMEPVNECYRGAVLEGLYWAGDTGAIVLSFVTDHPDVFLVAGAEDEAPCWIVVRVPPAIDLRGSLGATTADAADEVGRKWLAEMKGRGEEVEFVMVVFKAANGADEVRTVHIDDAPDKL